jgi:hypothetical protein
VALDGTQREQSAQELCGEIGLRLRGDRPEMMERWRTA